MKNENNKVDAAIDEVLESKHVQNSSKFLKKIILVLIVIGAFVGIFNLIEEQLRQKEREKERIELSKNWKIFEENLYLSGASANEIKCVKEKAEALLWAFGYISWGSIQESCYLSNTQLERYKEIANKSNL